MKQETVGWFIMKHETNYKRIYNFQVSVMFWLRSCLRI